MNLYDHVRVYKFNAVVNQAQLRYFRTIRRDPTIGDWTVLRNKVTKLRPPGTRRRRGPPYSRGYIPYEPGKYVIEAHLSHSVNDANRRFHFWKPSEMRESFGFAPYNIRIAQFINRGLAYDPDDLEWIDVTNPDALPIRAPMQGQDMVDAY